MPPNIVEHHCDAPQSLMIYVQNMVRNDPRTFMEIYAASGVPYHWLKKFANGEYQNPSVNRIEHLYTFYTGKELVL